MVRVIKWWQCTCAYCQSLPETQSRGLTLTEPQRLRLPSLSFEHIDWQTSPWKMDVCVVRLILAWDCYSRCIKWLNRQWKIITHAQYVSNSNLARQRKIYQEKNVVEHWSCCASSLATLCDKRRQHNVVSQPMTEHRAYIINQIQVEVEGFKVTGLEADG